MARLTGDNGHEIDLQLKIGIQSPDTGIIITLWKNGEPYLVPEEKSDYCDPEDYENYRLMDYEYLGTDDLLPMLQKYVKEIQADDNEHEVSFECWPEARIGFYLKNRNNSKTVNVKVIYENSSIDEVKFKNLDSFDGSYEFNTRKENIIQFSEQLEKEFQDETKPKRILLKESDAEDEPWDEEKKIIKKQKYIETEKPVILIDSDLLTNEHNSKEIENFQYCINELQKTYKVAVIGIDKEDFENERNNDYFKNLDGLIYLEDRCYPKNEELIFLRDNTPRYSMLSVFCCLNRAVTSIWFEYFCNSDWLKACEVIKEYAAKSIELTDLSDDDGTCGYVI